MVRTQLITLSIIIFLAAGTACAGSSMKAGSMDGTLPRFDPGTPATDIGVAKTMCVNGFAEVYFNKDAAAYATKKVCSEASGGTAANSRRVEPTNNGQGGKKCPSGTTEYTGCTPVHPLPCCYTNAN